MARKVYGFTTHEAAAQAEGRRWRRASVEERVSAVETIRQATIGVYDETAPRMARTYRFVVLPPRPLPDRRRARAGMRVAFLGRRELITNKRAAGRTKDLLDIALLEEVSPPPRRPRRR